METNSRTFIVSASASTALQYALTFGTLRRGTYFNTPDGGAGGGEGGGGAGGGEGGGAAAAVADGSSSAGNGAGGDGAQDGFTDADAVRLHDILARVEKDPDLELNEDELKLYMANQDGQLKPKAPPAEGKGPKEDKPADDAGDDAGDQGDKDKGSDEAPAVAPEVAEAMKHVGAKTPAELASKVKELRSAHSQMGARLKEAEDFRAGEAALYRDAAAGDPRAIQFLAEKRGIRVMPANSPDGKPGTGASAAEDDGMPADAANLEIDPEADALTNGALSQLQRALKAQTEVSSALQKKLETLTGTLEAEKQRVRAEGDLAQARSQTVEEMHEVAQLNDELKAIPDLKNRLVDFLQHGKDDPQLAPFFTELLKTAAEEGCSLKGAYFMLQGKNVAALIAKARQEGARSAYAAPKNHSMSGVPQQAGKSALETVTEAQIEAYENGDWGALPKSWFNAEGDFDPKRVPQKFHERLGIITQ